MVSRRGFLGGAAALAGAGVVSARVGLADEARETSTDRVPFYGEHQAGVTTRAQDRLAFASFDVLTKDRAELERLLPVWTAAAARMAQGRALADDEGHPLAPPVDTGEAAGLSPANLSITFGVGPSLFDSRFGLQHKRPAALAPLPALPGDQLDPARSGGDLCIQACADDPTVAFHAVRNLARLGRGTVAIRWFQLGFGRTSSTTSDQSTARNLMGFKDGTRNLKVDEAGVADEHVWVGDETDQPWMQGGSYLVARRIRMLLESWDRSAISEQQRVIGRHRDSGAPLGGAGEFDDLRLASSAIDTDAHVRLAAPESNGGAQLLRRGYSYTDGIDPLTTELDAGLFFLAFQKDAHRQFVPVQRRLGLHDALNEYIKHTGSALFAVPPGVRDRLDTWGSELFA